MTNLISKTQKEVLKENGRKSKDAHERGKTFDPRPVVKLFTPDDNRTWLLSEMSPDAIGVCFGLYDSGDGSPKLEGFLLSDIEAVRGILGHSVVSDHCFKADKPISKYAGIAHRVGHIVA